MRFYLGLTFLLLLPRIDATDREWRSYLGGPGREHYSPLTQVDKNNVGELEVAWEYHTGISGEMQCNPLVIDGTLYGVTASGGVFALDAVTGRELWRTDKGETEDSKRRRTLRGITYWEDGDDRRIFYSRDEWLCSINADTGDAIPSFGVEGRVNLKVGLGPDSENKWAVSTTPGTLFKDLLIMPLRTGEEGGAVPGYVQAFDVRSGKLVWTFRTIPLPGEFGRDTWPEGEPLTNKIGGANSWAGMAVDEERGMLFVPTGSAAPDFWGGDRHGSNLFANCLLALDAATGERIWHYQFVHHDLWDRDLPSPPNLVKVTHEGQQIDAVAQTTKSGHVFVFNRETGESLFPIEELPFPESPIEGESAWPTQPVPMKPAPFARQDIGVADISPFAENREELEAVVAESRHGAFEPFGLDATLLFPGFDGGAEWGGSAVDPEGVLYVNANEMAWLARLVEKPKADELSDLSSGQRVYAQFCVACHGPERLGNPASRVPSLIDLNTRMDFSELASIVKDGKGMMPGFGVIPEEDRRAVVEFLLGAEKMEGPSSLEADTSKANDDSPPYKLKGYVKFLDSKGFPAITPPWGTLTAIDLNTGEHKWQIPLGDVEEFSGDSGEPTGMENYGGPVVTASGLLFIAATKDGKIRAFDKSNGALLWERELPAAGFATPSIYEVKGKQYIAVAAGGTKLGTKGGDSYIAYALPDAFNNGVKPSGDWAFYPSIIGGTQFSADVGPKGLIHVISEEYSQIDLLGTKVLTEPVSDGLQDVYGFSPAIDVGEDGSVHVVTRHGEGFSDLALRYRYRDPKGNWARDYEYGLRSNRNYVVGVAAGKSGRVTLMHTIAGENVWGDVHLFSGGETEAVELGAVGGIWRADNDARIRSFGDTVFLVAGLNDSDGKASYSRGLANSDLVASLKKNLIEHRGGEGRRGYPDLAVDASGTSHLSYGALESVMYSQSAADGSPVFEEDVMLFFELGSWHLNTGLSSVAVSPDGKRVMVVALKTTSSNNEASGSSILCTYSEDGGKTWSEPEDIKVKTHGGEGRARPLLLAVENRFALLYNDESHGGISMAVKSF